MGKVVYVNKNQVNKNQQIPLRGLAMILIAVAVILAFWVVMSLVGGHGSGSKQASSVSASTSQSSSVVASTPQSSAPSVAPSSSEVPALPVSVLNNSMVTGLANKVSDRVKAAGFTVGQVGNYSASNFPNSVVLYPAGDAASQAEAEKVAQALGITAAVIPDGVDISGITVIAVSDLDK